MKEPVAILLAAGSAERFGAPKLLQPLPDGVPVGVAAAKVLQRALPKVVAVVRPDDLSLKAVFNEIGLEIIENPEAANGMGSSLATGVKATANASAWLIGLADMPWVKSETVAALVEPMRRGASMVAPVYQERRGNPVGFAACWFTELTRISGDRGARDLLVRHSDRLELVNTADAGVLADVDFPADLTR